MGMMSGPREQLETVAGDLEVAGFAVVRSFLDPSLVRDMRAEIAPILSAHYARYRDGDRSEARGDNRLAIDLKPYLASSSGALADRRFVRNATVEGWVKRRLGRTAPVWRGWTQVECVWPGSSDMTWHVDQMLQYTPRPHAPNRPIRMTYNVPLVRCTESNGAMQVVPGSHRWPRASLGCGDVEIRASDFQTLELEVGDIVLRDSNTLHRGTTNRTDEPRPLLDQTYHRVTAKFFLQRLCARVQGRRGQRATGAGRPGDPEA